MRSRLQNQNDARLAEQASEWLKRLDGAGPDEHQAFAKWLTESRRNVEEFLFATAVDKALESADPERRFDVKQLMEKANENVVSLKIESAPTPATSSPQIARYRWAAGFASVAIALGILWGQKPELFGGPERYTTAVGEQRTVRLQDGSLVQLNTRSRLEVRITSQSRELRLLEGEALFQVRRDPIRPFRVNAGSAVVQAVGTQFNIYKHGDSATVAVIEGAVGIIRSGDGQALNSALSSGVRSDPSESQIKLLAGQEASIINGGRIVKRESVNMQRAVAWRQRRLMFHKNTLVDIAEEFNRYNRAPQIRVEGETVRAKRYTGIFDADDPSSLIEYLARDRTLAFTRHDGEFVIRPRSQAPTN
jgi:transmembrane sensor